MALKNQNIDKNSYLNRFKKLREKPFSKNDDDYRFVFKNYTENFLTPYYRVL